MNRILTLPITVPLRILGLQLRIARGAAEVALGVANELADAAPWNRPEPDAGIDVDPSVPMAVPDPEAPAPGRARPRQSPRRTTPRRAPDIPPAPEEQPRPRPRRAA